jgi:hypothetical protein
MKDIRAWWTDEREAGIFGHGIFCPGYIISDGRLK